MPPRKARASSSSSSTSRKSSYWSRPELHERLKKIAKQPAGVRKRQLAVRDLLNDCILGVDRALVAPSLGNVVLGNGFPDLHALLDPKLVRKTAERKQLESVARSSFPAALAAWRRGLGLKLYAWLESCNPSVYRIPERASDTAKLDFLALATTVFFCTRFLDDDCDDESTSWYEKRIHYPYILSHVCQTAWYADELAVGEEWTPGGRAPDTERGEVIAGLVRACGLDPATATCADMDVCDARLACKLCLEKNLPDADGAGSWWNCLAHYHDAHTGTNSNPLMPLSEELRNPPSRRVEWARLNPTAEAKARELQPAVTAEQRAKWRCASCPAVVFDSWTKAEFHGLLVHNIRNEDLVRGEHFHMQDNYVNADLGDLVYIWQLRKAGLQEYFATRELDNFYFDKLIRLFGKIPVTFPSQPAENCWYSGPNSILNKLQNMQPMNRYR